LPVAAEHLGSWIVGHVTLKSSGGRPGSLPYPERGVSLLQLHKLPQFVARMANGGQEPESAASALASITPGQ